MSNMKAATFFHSALYFLFAAAPSAVQAQDDWHNKVFQPLSHYEQPLEKYRKPAALAMKQVFDSQRLPNIVVTKKGTLIAAIGWTEVLVRRSEDAGETWGDVKKIRDGIFSGGLTVDEISGDILLFLEDKHPPAPLHMFRSKDDGKNWTEENIVIHPNSLGHVPSMSMNEHGITLRRGQWKGRLIRPSRWYGRTNYPVEYFPTHYTNAIFSDDGGRTWKASEPLPLMGCGEACIAELSDGTLHYNTRRHWALEKEDSLWRWTATSRDGGKTWENPARSKTLPDGNQNTTYGLMGGMVRLPVLDRDILVFSNIVHTSARKNGHVWTSFDGGKTWPVRRQIFDGKFAYSSLSAGRPGTASEGWIFMHYEGGPQAGSTMARFNLSWILEGEKTGDGEVPEWVSH
jgi:sialidase-1